MSTSWIGKKVHHHRYGDGIVLRTRCNGSELLVRFSHWLLWLQVYEFVGASPVEEPRQPSPDLLQGASSLDIAYRRILEALRLGVVPFDYVEQFTLGRDEEIQRMNHFLEELQKKGHSLCLLKGEYGVGKSHLLDYLYFWLIRQNCLVARAELGASDSPPSRPKQVYRELIHTLRYVDEEGRICGFRDFMRLVAQRSLSTWVSMPQPHLYLRRIIQALTTGKENEELWQWIEGEASAEKPSLYPYANTANIYCYILTGLGWAARELGYKGLVIILDEGERVRSLPTYYQKRQGLEFLLGIIHICLGWKTDVLNRSPRASSLPYEYARPPGLMALLSFTTPAYYELTNVVHEFALHYDVPLNLHDNHQIALESLNPEALTRVFLQTLHFYETSYPDTIALRDGHFRDMLLEKIHDYLEERLNTRRFVKAVVEALDIMRFSPHLKVDDLEWAV